ncbi:MAG: hypothetical protein Q9163_005615 [Psora crenata]
MRPASEMLYNQTQSQYVDAADKAAEQWIAEIDQCETTLEEMAGATTDQDFKAELTAIEEWFKVLSEAERTASLYALLQQATKVQILFFIQTLEEMLRKHPLPGILSPTKFGDQAERVSDAAGKLESSRSSLGRPLQSPSNKRNSGLDPSTITAMFPDAAAAIAKKKAEYTQHTGNAPASNRNSAAFGDRSSFIAPSISEPKDSLKENAVHPSPTPWGQRPAESRPKSASSQQPMGQFSQPPISAGIRSPRPLQLSGESNVQSQSISVPDTSNTMPILSPYNVGNASWASMTNTPMQPSFNTSQANTQADMVANATAMKLAALSTVNNRIALDDVRKYQRRARSKEGDGNAVQMPLSPTFPQNVLVVNESGQLLNSQPLSAQQLAAFQAQQQAAFASQRGRPESPGITVHSNNFSNMGFTSPQNNGYLTAYDASTALNSGMGSLNLGQFGVGHGASHEGYLSDHSEMRGRSPRGRRGTSKPPEDPTDPVLLQDIPNWLRSLRLHKYTDNLKGMKWTELVELDDKGLEDKGVNALGARRKMLKSELRPLINLKVFEQVREAKAGGKL